MLRSPWLHIRVIDGCLMHGYSWWIDKIKYIKRTPFFPFYEPIFIDIVSSHCHHNIYMNDYWCLTTLLGLQWHWYISWCQIDIEPVTCLQQKCSYIKHEWLMIGRQCNFEVTHNGQQSGFGLCHSESHAGAHTRSLAKWQIESFVSSLALLFGESQWIEYFRVRIVLWIPDKNKQKSILILPYLTVKWYSILTYEVLWQRFEQACQSG